MTGSERGTVASRTETAPLMPAAASTNGRGGGEASAVPVSSVSGTHAGNVNGDATTNGVPGNEPAAASGTQRPDIAAEGTRPMQGKAHVYGDNVNTDVIFPGRYLVITEPKEMAKHAMEDLDKAFVQRVAPGDVVVAGRAFGCGSSREQAATCLAAAGVGAVIAESFARIFFRNAINKGLAVVKLADASRLFAAGDQVALDLAAGTVTNVTRGEAHRFEPIPPFLREILDAGGLIPQLRKRLARGPPG